MTIEEAIKELSVLWERMKRAKESGVLAYKTIMYYDGQYVEALDMAIQALEQTDVLDKVRAEIASYGAIWVEYIIPGHTDRDIEKIVENVLREAKEQVLDIIDKYKAESEE